MSLLQQTQHDAHVGRPPTAEEQPAAQGVRSARRPRRAAAADSAESAQIPPNLRTHCKPRVPQRASARVYSTRPCAKQSEWTFCLEHACELLGRALRRWRSFRSKDQLPSGRPKRSRSCSSCHSYGRQLRWRRGVREQASRGCPSTRNSILLVPALPAHFTWSQLAAPAYGPGWRSQRMIAHAVIAPLVISLATRAVAPRCDSWPL